MTSLYGQTVEVSGRIKGISDSSRLKIYFMPLKLYEDVVSEEVDCINGKFKIVTQLDTSMWHLVQIDCDEFNSLPDSLTCNYKTRTAIKVFIFPGDKLIIKAKKANFGAKFHVYGNKIASQQNEFKEKTFKLEQDYAETVFSKSKLITDSDNDDEIKNLKDKIDGINLVNIYRHLDWDYSAIILPGYELEIIKEIYNKLDFKVKESFFGRYVEEIINSTDP